MSHRFGINRRGSHANRTRENQRYGRAHREARADAARRHRPDHPCARCGHPLGPMGAWLHYDHDETGGYLGFSHGSKPCPWCGRKCNIRAGAIKGNAAQLGALQRRPRVPSGW